MLLLPLEVLGLVADYSSFSTVGYLKDLVMVNKSCLTDIDNNSMREKLCVHLVYSVEKESIFVCSLKKNGSLLCPQD